jgi:hypothetical protein
MGTTFVPLLMGHAEVRIDTRPATQPPVRDSGPVEGVWGNREVPPASGKGDRRAH